ncbi:MAG: bifunctional 4-hydroxy-2-oxoglutarate aldolase/2-dehydro-3-deoxy-phosphogluconate aldolase [Lewinellaceae bacterium]|nr:bifunctional 4-hydroxy-2-oxoglutarate aldolase/2-dehydro-3-deoxy-phosphogluconate aldolase [Lewinellaceae bacterium]
MYRDDCYGKLKTPNVTLKTTSKVLEQLKSSPIVPVFFHPDADYARQVVQACYAGGLRFVEFTNRGKEAFEVFGMLNEHIRVHCPGLSLGIGTIFTEADAVRFLDAGADFVVQPVTTAAVGVVCKTYQKPWIPGAMTPNEIWTAWQSGATVVKIFPGNLVGPDYIRALRGPMPDVPLMVTGGVDPTPDSIRNWLGAGVQAVGIGSQLFKGDFSGDFTALARRISGLLESIGLPASS